MSRPHAVERFEFGHGGLPLRGRSSAAVFSASAAMVLFQLGGVFGLVSGHVGQVSVFGVVAQGVALFDELGAPLHQGAQFGQGGVGKRRGHRLEGLAVGAQNAGVERSFLARWPWAREERGIQDAHREGHGLEVGDGVLLAAGGFTVHIRAGQGPQQGRSWS